MKPVYYAWIRAHVPANPVGLCDTLTEQMVATFPELIRVRGHYTWSASHERGWPHWWCVTADGTIVDPTAAQWPDGGAGVYEPHDESGPEPTGKCPNCGDYCYEGNFCCSSRCDAEYRAYLMSP